MAKISSMTVMAAGLQSKLVAYDGEWLIVKVIGYL
jgi:hypothetical protein